MTCEGQRLVIALALLAALGFLAQALLSSDALLLMACAASLLLALLLAVPQGYQEASA